MVNKSRTWGRHRSLTWQRFLGTPDKVGLGIGIHRQFASHTTIYVGVPVSTIVVLRPHDNAEVLDSIDDRPLVVDMCGHV